MSKECRHFTILLHCSAKLTLTAAILANSTKCISLLRVRVIEGERIPAIAMATTINLSYIFFIFLYTLFAIEEYFTRNPFPATPFPLPYRPN